MINLYDQVDFVFHINWHSVGQWLLYGLGSIMDTPTADDPIFVALSGTDKQPAIQVEQQHRRELSRGLA